MGQAPKQSAPHLTIEVRGVAGLLLLPYLLWVGFASVLTWTLWRSNPGLL